MSVVWIFNSKCNIIFYSINQLTLFRNSVSVCHIEMLKHGFINLGETKVPI